MIQPIGFLDTRQVTARYVLKYAAQSSSGILKLRDLGEDGEPHDLPLLREWSGAKALLARIKTGAAALNGGRTAFLGKAWIEQLPGGHGTPWLLEDDDYAQAHIRTRTCLIGAPDCYTFSGKAALVLGTGMLNVVEHRVLHSENNLSEHSRVHLVVDVKRPELDG